MAYDATAAQVELNQVISDVNASLGTSLKFISISDVVKTVGDPRAATTSIVDQVNATPEDEIGSIAEQFGSDPTRLADTWKIVQADLKSSPNLTAAFNDASQILSLNDFIGLVSPLASLGSIALPSGGGTIFDLISKDIQVLGIKF